MTMPLCAQALLRTWGRHAGCARRVRCPSFAERLLAAERDADSLTALELMTEVRLLNVDVEDGALEAGIRTVAAASGTKAYQLLEERLLNRCVTPSVEDTLPLLFRALADSGEAALVVQLLDRTEADIQAHASRDRSLNFVLRCLTKVDLGAAVRKAEAYRQSGVVIEAATYSQLAAKCLAAGDFALAEQMLEERDYL